jgi:hypothetical protein
LAANKNMVANNHDHIPKRTNSNNHKHCNTVSNNPPIHSRSQKYVKANTNAYQKLSEINRQMVEMVKETEKKHIATLSNTAATYREKTGKQITKTQLLKRLSEIEKTGIIKRVIANQNDEPIITWKTQIRSNNKRESQHAQKQN